MKTNSASIMSLLSQLAKAMTSSCFPKKGAHIQLTQCLLRLLALCALILGWAYGL